MQCVCVLLRKGLRQYLSAQRCESWHVPQTGVTPFFSRRRRHGLQHSHYALSSLNHVLWHFFFPFIVYLQQFFFFIYFLFFFRLVSLQFPMSIFVIKGDYSMQIFNP